MATSEFFQLFCFLVTPLMVFLVCQLFVFGACQYSFHVLPAFLFNGSGHSQGLTHVYSRGCTGFQNPFQGLWPVRPLPQVKVDPVPTHLAHDSNAPISSPKD
eukprot:TRINITY_DN2685_c0_g1_i14.p1 TRINITY_DN2685_c0_g1~~TRINITY_DN2685_c0_g1_i14.p1  ORF type:complete len:102 (-),score=7.37 TRINITY_DN2685_c0_g1_i14:340-645(-)